MNDETVTSPSEDRTITYTHSSGRFQHLVRTYESFNPEFNLVPRTGYLHHLLREEDYYREFVEAISGYLSELTEDLVRPKHIHRDVYNYKDLESYEAQLSRTGNLLNHDPDYFLAPLMFDNEAQGAEWRKFDISSISFSHRYRVSKYLYEFVFARIWRHGGVYLEVYYPTGRDSLNALTGKAVRLVDNSPAVAEMLPPTGEFWPKPGYITGANNYEDFTRLFSFRYDSSGREHDEGVIFEGTVNEDTGPEAGAYYNYPVQVDPTNNFDGTIAPLILDRTLVLSMTVDRILRLEENALRTVPSDCLQDIPFLQYVERRGLQNKKTVERLKVGTQLTLACDTTGFFVKQTGSNYTMPDIALNATVIRANYEENNEIATVRVGTGTPMGTLRNLLFQRPGGFQKLAVYGESSTYDESVYNSPEAWQAGLNGDGGDSQITGAIDLRDFRMMAPAFGTAVGEFETIQVSAAVTAINTMIEKQELNGLSPEVFIYSPEDLEGGATEPELISLSLPHEYLTQGTFVAILDLHTFHIRIGAEVLNPLFNSPSFSSKMIPIKDFLFNPSTVTEDFDILPLLLYDFRHLRFFGSETGTPNTPPAALNDGWAELHELMTTGNGMLGYNWFFADVTDPDTGDTLSEFILALDPTIDDINEKVTLDFFGDGITPATSTASIEWVQQWVEEGNEKLVRFYPVGDYSIDGEAEEISEEDALSDAKINWAATGWTHELWYSYAPQYMWRVYIRIVEDLTSAEGWTPKVEYMVFNDFTFREALRFFDMEVERDTIVTDIPLVRRNEILQEFFLSLGNGGIYATTSAAVDDDPYRGSANPPHDGSIFSPTFIGAQGRIPLIVVHNYFRVDKLFEFASGTTGVEFLREEGRLRFKLRAPTELSHYVTPAVGTNTIQDKALISTFTTPLNIRYVINTTKNFADPLDITSQIIGIREVGLFNTEDKLIAYANFPPIIYDSFENHLAINWYISDTEFTTP